MEKLNNSSCIINRPGGFIITDRALRFCSFPIDAKILDVGCGKGATVNHLKNDFGFDAFGIDKNPLTNSSLNNIIITSAEKIPLSTVSLDGVFMECSLSMMDNQDKVLRECYRVLKNDGYLVVSDIYARGEAAQLKGSLGRIDTKEEIVSLIEHMKFKIELFEDFSNFLLEMWGQMIFDKGTEAFYCDLGASPEMMKQIKCGYYLIIARKK